MGIKILKNSKAFIDYSQFIDLHENLEDYNPIRKKRVLIVFDDMIADMESNKKLSPLVTELILKEKTQYLACFYITVLFQSALNYKTKCNTLFYQENS